VAAILIAFPVASHGAELRLISTGLFRAVLPLLTPTFERASGNKIIVSISTPGVLRDRLLKGEAFDIALLPSSTNLDDVVKAGVFTVESRQDIGRTFLGMAVQPNAKRPDLGTPEAVKSAILAAKSVALTDPSAGAPIGTYVQQVAEKFGFGAELRSRIKPIAGSGEDVARAVSKGEAEVGISLASEIAAVPEAAYAGPLPVEMQLDIVRYGVVLSKSSEKKAARAFIEFLATPEARKVMKEKGIDPI
jgi:molybdate transport system substrate-binding protein